MKSPLTKESNWELNSSSAIYEMRQKKIPCFIRFISFCPEQLLSVTLATTAEILERNFSNIAFAGCCIERKACKPLKGNACRLCHWAELHYNGDLLSGAFTLLAYIKPEKRFHGNVNFWVTAVKSVKFDHWVPAQTAFRNRSMIVFYLPAPKKKTGSLFSREWNRGRLFSIQDFYFYLRVE